VTIAAAVPAGTNTPNQGSMTNPLMRAHTVANFERGEALKTSTVEVIQRTLEKAGIMFIDANDGGPGARLRSQGTERKQ
jgi:hypothetical protein